MGNVTKAPNLDEFKNQCRTEFEFLINDFGFKEQKLSLDNHKNEFIIEFVRDDLQVIIEGVSYGSVAIVFLRNSKGRGIWIEYLDPKFQPFIQRKTDGQLEDIRRQAILLREYGLELLKGDYSVLESAFKRGEAATKEYKNRLRK
jgi:hypothetical protein